MISIKDLLKRNDIRAYRYQKKGNSIIVDSEQGKFVIKKQNKNKKIYQYLINRQFQYYPKILDTDNEYELYPYIEDMDIPIEQKMHDLIPFIALLHAKTTYYKTIDESDYKELYEDISNNIIYLKDYYTDLISLIDEKIFFNPSDNLLANNISLIFSHIKECEDKKELWYKSITNHHKIRVSVVHNNLKLDHFLQNDQKYLISWDKAKIDLPIFDLYKLYLNHYDSFDFIEILKTYENDYKLKEEEKLLLYILLSMPQKLELSSNEYENCIIIKNELKRLLLSQELSEILIKTNS